MTSANISDVSTVNTPINQYKSEKKEDSGEFAALMAGSLNSMPNPQQNANAGAMDMGRSLDVKSTDTKSEVREFNPTNTKVENVSKDNDISNVDTQKVTEKIEEFVEEVKDVIKEELGVSDEEITEAMETLGLNFVDLAVPENLSALVKELNPVEDTAVLLLDDGVRNVFDTVSDLSTGLLNETGLDTEGLISVMEMEPVTEDVEIPLEEMPVMEEVPLEVKTETEPEVSGETREIRPERNDIPKDTIRDERPQNNIETSDEEPDDTVAALNEKIISNSKQNNQSNAGTGFGNTGGETTGQGQTMAETTPSSEPVVTANPMEPQSLAAEIAEAVPEVPVYTEVDTADVINQIVTQARTEITANVRSMELELNPHNLGRMLMQVSEHDGQVSARFITQNEAVKAALESAISTLIEKLNEQGIKVDAVEVSVATHEFEQNLEQNFAGEAREDLNQEQQNKPRMGGIHLGDPDYMEGVELTEEEELTANIMRDEGNTVNFRA